MTSVYRKLVVTAALILTLLAAVAAGSTPEPPAVPRDYVTDLADVIQPEIEARLNGILQELEQKTTAQVLVLTVRSLDGQSIEEFAITTKEKWRLGQKGKDNGVLIAVAVADKKYRLEVGYGLEEALPDSLVGTIGREYLVPSFRKGDYSAGTYAGTLAVATTIATHEGVEIAGMPAQRQRHDVARGRPLSLFQMILFGFLGVVALILFITHPRQCILLVLASQMGGGRGGWSGGGGGFGGGSFGGGGGGSGGGGGASGGW